MNNIPTEHQAASGATTAIPGNGSRSLALAELPEISDREAQDLQATWEYLDAQDQGRLLESARALAKARADLRALEERARRQRQIEKNQGAIQLLRSWDAEDAAMTPEQQQTALAEWEG